MDFLYVFAGITIPLLIIELRQIRARRIAREKAEKTERDREIADRMRIINATPYLWGFGKKEVGRFPFDRLECVQYWNDRYGN